MPGWPVIAIAQRAGLGDLVAEHVRSCIDRKTGADVLTNVPGIHVHPAIEAMMWALEEFFLSMLDVNIIVGQSAGTSAAHTL